jgi:hypothetical protein
MSCAANLRLRLRVYLLCFLPRVLLKDAASLIRSVIVKDLVGYICTASCCTGPLPVFIRLHGHSRTQDPTTSVRRQSEVCGLLGGDVA